MLQKLVMQLGPNCHERRIAPPFAMPNVARGESRPSTEVVRFRGQRHGNSAPSSAAASLAGLRVLPHVRANRPELKVEGWMRDDQSTIGGPGDEEENRG